MDKSDPNRESERGPKLNGSRNLRAIHFHFSACAKEGKKQNEGKVSPESSIPLFAPVFSRENRATILVTPALYTIRAMSGGVANVGSTS